MKIALIFATMFVAGFALGARPGSTAEQEPPVVGEPMCASGSYKCGYGDNWTCCRDDDVCCRRKNSDSYYCAVGSCR